MVIRGGENIYPREVEEFLHAHPDVAEVPVIGVPDARYGEELMAWIVLREGASLDRGRDREYCDGRIAHYKVPRYVATVVQNYALYPYLDVAANLAFPLKMARVKGAERDRARAREAELLDLTPYLQRKPAQLSGGQRQRVAMGRAIIRKPQVFLMDEPLSNLDAKLRVQMRAEIASLQSRLGVTTVFVTHDQVEAMTMGHRVAVLRDGRLQQCDTPRRLYDRPANVFVAGFIGSPAMNLCTLAVVDGRAELGGQALAMPAGVNGAREVVVGLRPESLELADDGLPGRVEIVERARGRRVRVLRGAAADRRGAPRGARRCPHPPASGDRVGLRPRLDEAHLFDSVSGARLGG